MTTTLRDACREVIELTSIKTEFADEIEETLDAMVAAITEAKISGNHEHINFIFSELEKDMLLNCDLNSPTVIDTLSRVQKIFKQELPGFFV